VTDATVRLAHLVLLAVWGGLLSAEFIVEALATDVAVERVVARLHFLMDILIELPILLGVLTTGIVLAVRAWPLTPLHWIKLSCALTAMGFNAYCAVLVVARHRTTDDARRAALTRSIRLTGLGLPFGVAAFYLGMVYFFR